jgi:hypothetical protein
VSDNASLTTVPSRWDKELQNVLFCVVEVSGELTAPAMTYVNLLISFPVPLLITTKRETAQFFFFWKLEK